MCTLTWTAKATESGYSAWFNRDERLTRAAEIPPRIQTSPGGVQYIAPEDSEAGGTWIATNEFGLTVALLNGYVVSRGPARDAYESRGILVRELAGLERPQRALGLLSPRALEVYRPAVVYLKAPGEPAMVARWDGLTVSIDLDAERQLPLTSSSYEQENVQHSRRELYSSLVRGPDQTVDPLAPDAESLAAFQRYVDPVDGPTAFTPTMQRSDAATRSQCEILVTDHTVRFGYRPGAPHVTDVSVQLELPRRGTGIGT